LSVASAAPFSFPDRPAAYRETRRVPGPAGRYLFNVWDRLEANQFAALVTETLAAIYPDDPPRFSARTPHGYHDTARIRADLADAGFGTVEIVTQTEKSQAPSAWHVASAYCRGTPLRAEIEAMGAGALDAAIDRATAAIEMRYGSGPVAAPIQAHVMIAIA
jgi:hypothetical protein